MKRRRVLLIAALIVIPLGALTILVMVPIVGAVLDIRAIVDRAHRGRDHLFRETDYHELLAACRELSRRTASGELESRQYHIHLGDRDPETLSFPQVILDLEPANIAFDLTNQGEVWIELMPGPDWFGVVAFPEGRQGRGDVKLIDGLWYFDSEYGAYNGDPSYRQKVDAIVREGQKSRARRESAGQHPPEAQG